MTRIQFPTDKYGRPLYNLTPCATALARTVKALTSSFAIQLESDTTYIRVYAIAKDVYLKWAIDDNDYVSAEDFDEVIPAGQYIDFAIPVQSEEAENNGELFPYIQLVGRESGSTVVVIEK